MIEKVYHSGKIENHITLPIYFILIRLILFASLPYEVIPGYGDHWNFFMQSGLGFPFFDYWTEFPPVFPILSRLFFCLVEGREQAYGYILAIFFTIVQAGCIWLFLNILQTVRPNENPERRGWLYFLFTAGLFYTWGYFDTLALFFMLLGVYWILLEKDIHAILAVSLGILTKWFPILMLPAIWKVRKTKKAILISLSALVIVIAAWFVLFTVNADYTKASILSQLNKGSWETIWALLDGNLHTGNFAPEVNRLFAETASLPTGNPAVIPAWLTLVIIGGFGFVIWFRSKPTKRRWLVDFLGLTFIIFFLWLPGYSPQWVLFLIPLLLISLEFKEAVLFGTVLVLVHLLEWPVLLSRGAFWALNFIVPLRTGLFLLLGLRFYQRTRVDLKTSDGETYAA